MLIEVYCFSRIKDKNIRLSSKSIEVNCLLEKSSKNSRYTVKKSFFVLSAHLVDRSEIPLLQGPEDEGNQDGYTQTKARTVKIET